MRTDDRGVTRCALCNQPLDIKWDRDLRFTMHGVGGHPAERVVTGRHRDRTLA
jgi:hypothetical protein